MRIAKPITSPCAPQPKQWKNPLSSLTKKLGLIFVVERAEALVFAPLLDQPPRAARPPTSRSSRERISSRKAGAAACGGRARLGQRIGRGSASIDAAFGPASPGGIGNAG
jgi:hypothetical protein